ncbi:unnamed protein product [Danaus chrysippus]|uniref:(African queen) hypothetical protein n=1 Tax=Danaus chrysippus TaxID=151541 RepID=A0A8J2R871_9NEOP|nr:unnamed protein product [Danaus chrysippus]
MVRQYSVKAARGLRSDSLIPKGSQAARTMLVFFAITLAVAAAAPPYDQRQEGEFNVHADVQNVVLLLALPKKVPYFLDLFSKSSKSGNEPIAQDRADVQVMEAFVEPSTPYRVEIGPETEKYADSDGKSAEIVIASRRHTDPEPLQEDEMKLIGATEQCGPGRQRDPVTLMCRRIEDSEKIPEVVLASS